MRLLLRASSHRCVDGAIEIASSPDTPRRERWKWHLRVLPAGIHTAEPNTTAMTLDRSDGSVSEITVTVDPAAVACDVEAFDLTTTAALERAGSELVVVVVGAGIVLVEDRHTLRELDAMVLAGDDPLHVTVTQVSAEPVSLTVIRLRSADADSVAWVP